MITVRTAEVADADRIAEIHVRTWQAAYRGVMPDDLLDGLDVAEWARRRRQWIAGRTPPAEVFVAETDGAGPAPVMVGHSSVGSYRHDDGTRDATAGEVSAIYVDAAHWSTGAGYALMRASVEHLAAQGRSEVRLWVLEDNPRARRFYERFGFVADGAAKTETMGADGPTPAVLREVRYTLRLG